MSTVLPGQDTLIACWSALAETSPGARVHRSARAVVATFPSWLPLNNAIVLDDDPATRSVVASEVARVYADAGVDVWALWVASCAISLDAPDRAQEVPGLERDTTTLVMRALLSPGFRTHDEVVEASMAAIVRLANEEPVPAHELGAPETTPGLSAWALVVDRMAAVCAWTFLHHAGLRHLRRRDAAGLATQRVGAHAPGARARRRATPRGPERRACSRRGMGQPLSRVAGIHARRPVRGWVSR